MANGWSCNGTRFRMRWKIDVLFNEAKPRGGGGEAELNRTSIFHRMRNIVPLHRSKPLAICFVQHLEYQRNRIRLIRISYLGWVKFHSFYSSWLNIASARSKRNAYFIHKTISVRDKTAQIHTNTQRKVIVTSYALLRMDVARACNSTQLLNGWAPIGAYTTSFLGVVQYKLILKLVSYSIAGVTKIGSVMTNTGLYQQIFFFI